MPRINNFDEQLREVERSINRLTPTWVAEMHLRGTEAAGEIVAEETRRTAPYRTGALSESVRVGVPRRRRRSRRLGRGSVPGATVRVGGEGARHAHLVEFGTRHSRAQPFFERAIRHTLDGQRAAYDSEAGRTLEALAAAFPQPRAT